MNEGFSWRCDRCPTTALLVARIHTGEYLCAECWRLAGSPYPRAQPTAEELHAATVAIQQRMLRRGGDAAYRVKSGQS